MVIKKAYAKINIGLRILGKREDGYHDIETIFHRTNIFDRLIFELNKEIFISVSGFPLPNDNNNLSLRAANLLRQSYNLPFGVKIGLEKNIPIGAGLGGGSSDAAATLLGLRTLWNLPISIAELNVLAQQLGADVPYFLHDDSAYGTGRGDTLEYFHLDLPYWIVLVYPAIHVSTAWAYSQCPAKQDGAEGAHKMQNAKLKKTLLETILENVSSGRTLSQLIHNDFEEVVFSEYPVIGEIKKEFMKCGAVFAQMSGSGSSVYGFFTSQDAAQHACNIYHGQYRTFLTPPHFQPE